MQNNLIDKERDESLERPARGLTELLVVMESNYSFLGTFIRLQRAEMWLTRSNNAASSFKAHKKWIAFSFDSNAKY